MHQTLIFSLWTTKYGQASKTSLFDCSKLAINLRKKKETMNKLKCNLLYKYIYFFLFPSFKTVCLNSTSRNLRINGVFECQIECQNEGYWSY